jgi:hypothetical protein
MTSGVEIIGVLLIAVAAYQDLGDDVAIVEAEHVAHDDLVPHEHRAPGLLTHRPLPEALCNEGFVQPSAACVQAVDRALTAHLVNRRSTPTTNEIAIRAQGH